jgi:hypothetical protein
MSAGSLTLGGNLSIAVGPLGRNAEGSGNISSSGKVAAMYSYSKTKGLFGGVSVEGSVIVERQDANRLAYGGSPSAKQILNGTFDPPEWSHVLIHELERCTAGGTERYRTWEQEEAGAYGNPLGQSGRDEYGEGNRSRSGSAGSYAFGDGLGAGGVLAAGRRRAGSLLKKEDKGDERPGMQKRTSSFQRFNSGLIGSSTPKRAPILSSSESYNAGLTWDSDGPVKTGNRSRSGSLATPARRPVSGTPMNDNLLQDWEYSNKQEPIWNGTVRGEKDLLGSWAAEDNGLSASFNRLSTNGGITKNGSGSNSPAGRSRSGTTNSRPYNAIDETGDYVPYETESRFAKMSQNDRSSFVRDNATKRSSTYANTSRSPFGPDSEERTPFDDYRSPSPPPLAPKPNLSVRDGLDGEDGYARALALYEFKATAAGDLGMAKGDVVLVLDKVGSGEWWKGRAKNGQEGIFPSNYIEVVGLPKNNKSGVTRMELKARMADLGFD